MFVMKENSHETESNDHSMNGCYFVDGWKVSPDTLRIKKGEKTVKLEPKVMQVLTFLANRPREVIHRQELEDHIWQGVIVGYDAVTNTVIKLRKAFGDDSKHPTVIETVPKIGYRLIADVETEEPKPLENLLPEKATSQKREQPILRWPLFALGIVILAIFLAIVFNTSSFFNKKYSLPLPDLPSLAVLPLQNIGDNPQQAYFSDGITEDLITDLSNISGLFVIARNSSFQYKDKPVDVKSVANELGVRYILQGSVRRDKTQFRINVQLMDSVADENIWAERYDGTLDNLFEVQDEVTRKITTALSIQLTHNEQSSLSINETLNVASYDEFLKGWERYWKFTRDDFAVAEMHFNKALEIDPENSRAHAALALIYWKAWQLKWHENHGTPHEGWRRANKEIELAMKNPTPLAHSTKSSMLLINRRYEESIAEAEKAIKLNENNAMAYLALAEALNFSGQPGRAIEYAKKGMRLDPNFTRPYLLVIGRSQFDMGLYEDSNKSLNCDDSSEIKDCKSLILAIANYGYLNMSKKAKLYLAKLNESNKQQKTPVFTVDRLKHRLPYRTKADRDHLFRGLEKAGVPLW